MTRLVPIDPAATPREIIEQAADALLDGGLVVYPTDTLYGLGCDATNPAAVARLCALKGRPPTAPLPVILHQRAALRLLVEAIPPDVDALLNRFWPGALTVVFRRRGAVLSAIAPPGTLGVRIPDAPVALALARALARPIVATSANLHGAPPVATGAEAQAVFGEGVDLILDAGAIPGGTASTILDLSGERPAVLREGAIARALLARYLPGLAA